MRVGIWDKTCKLTIADIGVDIKIDTIALNQRKGITMMSDKKIIRNSRERGNALFLILIAVALFAALSYAITQSGRGGGSVSQQTALITAGQVTEQPADVRSATTRMILTGITGTSIVFDTSASQNNVFDTVTGGGGATNVPPPSHNRIDPHRVHAKLKYKRFHRDKLRKKLKIKMKAKFRRIKLYYYRWDAKFPK